LKDAFHAKADLARDPSVDPRRIFLIGQSNGGSVALLAASHDGPNAVEGSEAFRAVAAYYPWCGALQPNPALVSPLLVLGAGRDDWVSAHDCRRRFSKTRGAAAEVVIYPEAHHSFDLAIPFQAYAGRHVGGDPGDTEDSRRRILAFFKRHMTDGN
jgi:dienelactone hydrolase